MTHSSITTIGNAAFTGCLFVEKVHIDSIEAWCNIDFPDFASSPKGNLYINNQLVTELIIPETITSIGDYAFYSCEGLTSLTVHSKITYIGEWAFRDCESLKDVYYKSNLNDWEQINIHEESGLSTASIHFNTLYSFETNGGSTVSSIYTCYGILSAPITTKKDLTFVGWYENENLNGRAITFPYFKNADTKLYAKWMCKVTYEGEDFSYENNTVLVEKNSNVILPSPQIGYKYIFTVNGEPWDGTNITQNITVSVEKVLSDECDIIEIISPKGGTITDKTINFKVPSNLTSVTPAFRVSEGANWDLYALIDSTSPMTSKTITIPKEGFTVIRYIKVIAADNESYNTYTANFYRNTKSISPVITAIRDKVTIAAANCDIYYTTDGSIPTKESTKYIGVFSAPSKATIRAIAVETGKDEISDIVSFEIPEYFTTTMIGVECFDLSDGTCYYTIEIESNGTPSGEFIVAVYDIDGRLIGIKTEPKTIDKKETITNTIAVNGTPHTYKAFFWNSLGNLMPFCNNAEGTVIK